MAGNRNQQYQPLIDLIEGKEQEDRATLYSAFARIRDRANWPHEYDLAVRELLFYIRASDRDGNGVQLSFPEIAKRLETTDSRARRIVDRASKHYSLLAVKADYNARGGRIANRYSIDWIQVHLVNRGESLDPPPPAVCVGGPAVCVGGPAASAQAIKEDTRTKPEFFPLTTTTTTTAIAGTASSIDHGTTVDWGVVVVSLQEVGVADRNCRPAIAAAARLGMTPETVMQLVAHYRELPDANKQPSWLFRWLTMKGSAPKLTTPASETPRKKGKPFQQELRTAYWRNYFRDKIRRMNKGLPLSDAQEFEVDSLTEDAVQREYERFVSSQGSDSNALQVLPKESVSSC